MTTIIVLSWFLASYLIGAIPFGLLIGKCCGIDIRKTGSCNIGATNVTRSVGKTAGKICFFLDFLKGALPVAAAQLIYEMPWLTIGCGAAAILGHIFPVFLKFKGGKGISTAAGAIFAIAPCPLLAALAVWVVVFELSGYVSLGSIAAAVALPVFAFVCARYGIGSPLARGRWMLLFFLAAAVLAIWRHRSNIRRLLDGTESSFKKSKNPPPEA